ncbi:5-formyltetrahydrofolate cyclo-ligase [Bullifex porci]|uniref:5-formyltetrahydrofolate cyclo-ligase n=1 Tax=Bullifex porci TaxID=2606638 RepID=UPI0023F15873|nr:5-formyltetrahydrofolate cyclo-ligase [Bullifex porci]
MDKMILRRSFRGLETNEDSSIAVVRKLKRCKELIAADTLLLYYPLKDEIDIKPLYSLDKRIFLPVIENNEMLFRRYDGDLKKGKFGIMEPTGEYYTIGSNDLMIVPAVAYDRDGYRLGRGKGFYDRFLADKKIKTIGVVSKLRIVSDVFREPNDIKVDFIITD